MTTATGITHQTENFELRNRRLSSPSDQNPFDGKPTTEQLDAHRKSTAADPLPRGPSDISSFRSLIATNKSATDILLSLPESSSTTLFYVQNGSFKRNTPSVKLCYSTKEGPVIATLKLGWGRDNTFGLGDPAKGDPIDWENMRRVSDWTHSTYQFSYGSDSTQGGRKTFVWVRTKQGFWSDQPNMELREKSITGELGEVLGIYQGMILTNIDSPATVY